MKNTFLPDQAGNQHAELGFLQPGASNQCVRDPFFHELQYGGDDLCGPFQAI